NVIVSKDNSAEAVAITTGESIARVRGDTVRIRDDGYVYVFRKDEVEVFDARSFRTLFGPVEIDDDLFGLRYDGRHLVVLVDDELQFIDASGKE
ncbi:MAG TPA: hypothetical protein PLV68_01535, partial [Ilumatobacteraceae bacterium]|nr:hypothetical protein [Ilumatobacteraceae bacterium]